MADESKKRKYVDDEDDEDEEPYVKFHKDDSSYDNEFIYVWYDVFYTEYFII